MKLKLLAAAALLASSLHATAAISLPSNAATLGDSEMFFTVYNDTVKVSYTLDLGVFGNSFISLADGSNNGYQRSWSMDEFFATYLNTAGNNVADWRWMVQGADMVGSAQPNQRYVLSTVTAGQGITATTGASVGATTNAGVTNSAGAWDAYLNAINNGQGNAPFSDFAKNGGYTSTDPSLDYAILPQFINNRGGVNNFAFSADNAVGAESSFVYFTRSGTSNLASTRVIVNQFNNTQFDGRFNFAQNAQGQYELTYNLQAVPEPGAVAMMLAGLGAVGFVGRRRRQSR
jgi:PEP-CTERM motif